MFDLTVIGSGPAGYTAALLAARKGLKTALVERADFGGTCTNTGCIPTKTYCESVKVLHHIQDAKKFGISVGQAELGLAELKKRKDRVVLRLRKGIELLLKQAGVEVFCGEAELCSSTQILIGEQLIETAKMVIASGGKPVKPAIFERPGVYTSDEIFDLTEVPASLAIVGGGVIGLEMAGIFEALGSKVTVIEMLPRILATEDAEVSQEVVKTYRKVRFMTETAVESVSGEPGQLVLGLKTSDGPAELEVAAVLLAIGRRPNLPTGCAELGIELNARGGIRVDEGLRTSCQGVYAVGDVTGEYTLAYVAAREAEAAVWDILGQSHPVDYRNIPSIIFTQPEIASVGTLSNAAAGIRSGSFPVAALGRARTMEASTGFARVYADDQDRLLRVSLMGPNVTELISWASLAVEQGLTLAEFVKPCYPHPTVAEMLKEAAEDARGLCLNK